MKLIDKLYAEAANLSEHMDNLDVSDGETYAYYQGRYEQIVDIIKDIQRNEKETK